MTNKTLRIPLIGGLGNQLFQWVQGVHLQSLYSWNVKYDVALLRRQRTPRQLEIRELIATEIVESNPLVTNLALGMSHYVSNPFVHFVKDTSPLSADSIGRRVRMVCGYFQDLELVNSVQSEILERLAKSLRFRPLSCLERKPQIAVHVRLGDYVSDPAARSTHGLLDPDYYLQGIRLLHDFSRIDRIVLVTDDTELANARIASRLRSEGLNTVEIVSNADPVADLVEIASSACVVGSNSSFSWWGAWLGSISHMSTVVMPRPWFTNPILAEPNLFPSTWTRINV